MSAAAKSVCVLTALLGLAAGCGGEKPKLHGKTPMAGASLSAARAKIAEPVDLALSVEHPGGTEALFPPVEAELGGLEVARAGKVASKEMGPGWMLTTRKLTLRGFRAGAYTIEPLDIKLVDDEMPVPQKAPTVGQHTDEVLDEVLGYDRGRIGDLRDSGAVA